ncbi:hypothetical protein FF1_019155 [Malus domestica]
MKEIRTKTTEEIIDLVILLACLLLNVREIEKGNGKRLSRKFDLQWKKSIVVRPHPSLKKLQEEEAAEKSNSTSTKSLHPSLPRETRRRELILLTLSLEVLSAKLLPKKKFAFRNKPTRKDLVAEPKNEENEHEPEKKSGFEFRTPRVSETRNERFWLMGYVRALFVHRLRNCKVYTGPVTSLVLIDGVKGCVFVMGSH